jgi:tetratricopeptide (TPR) repeat protein
LVIRILEQGNYIVNNCKDCCTEEKKRCDSIDEKLKALNEQLPEAQLKKAQRFKKQGDKDASKKVLDSSIKRYQFVFAESLWERGKIAEEEKNYGEAMTFYRQAVWLDEKNPTYLMSAGKIARSIGGYEESKKWLETLLLIRVKEKKDDRNFADAKRELASLYDERGGKDDQAKAEKLYQEAIKIYEKNSGANSSLVANVLHDLADYYRTASNYEKAVPLFERCLDIMEKTLDKNDPNMANVLANFALLRKETGKIDEADQLFSRSLAICDAANVIGNDCNDIGTIKNDAAEFYESQERYKEAEQRYIEALSILKAKFPAGHHDIEKVQKNYDRLKQKMAEQ